MADRTVRVRLEAAIAGYQAAMAQASASTRKFGGDVAKMSRTHREEMQTVGTAATVMGAGILAGLGASAKAAMDFESSFAGVRKTVNATEPEFEAMAEGFRQMAREIPVSVNELNAIGEAAGQLGIHKSDILGFTRTMADLGETTNLTSTEAATSLARFMNIMQSAPEDVGRLGSALVELGNNSETTESEILELATRLAAAGQIAGLSESDVMAFAATLTSVGVEAEAGGTALSKVFTSIRDSVLDGGEQLDTFARVAGTTAQDFARSFEQDPSRAIASFIAGLGRMNDAGQSTTGVFSELELTDQRLMRALLSTASAGDHLTDRLTLGAQAVEDNTALTEEAAQRYETLESRVAVAGNAINDAAISLGQVLTPALGFAADGVASLAGGFADLPGPAQAVTAGVGGVLGTVSLASGAFLLAAPRIVATRDAMAALATQMPRTVGAMRAAGTFLTGPWGIALGVAAVGMMELGRHSRETEEVVGRLRATLQGAEADFDTLSDAMLVEELRNAGVLEIFRDTGLHLDDMREAMTGSTEGWRDFAAEVQSALGPGNDMLALLDTIPFVDTQQDADRLVEVIGRGREGLIGYNAELEAEVELLGGAASATSEAAAAADDYATSTEAATNALVDKHEQLRAQADPMFALIAATREMEQAQADYDTVLGDSEATITDVEDAELRLAEAALAMMSASGEAAGMFDGTLDPAMRRTLESAGLTAGQIAAVEQQFIDAADAGRDFEGDYYASVRAEGLGTTLAGMRELSRLADRTGVHIAGVTGRGGITARADGGPVDPSMGPVLVGERGPELVTFASFGMVHSAAATSSMLAAPKRQRAAQVAAATPVYGAPLAAPGGAGGGGDLHVHIEAGNIVGSEQALLDTVVKGIRDYGRRSGGGDLW